MSHQLSAAQFEAYALWARELWAPGVGPTPARDVAVMALGLPGEYGEMLEALEACCAAGEYSDTYRFELGDVAYNLACIQQEFGLEVEGLLMTCSTRSCERPFVWSDLQNEAWPLGKAIFRICELVKKHIRDSGSAAADLGFRAKLAMAVQAAFLGWLSLCCLTEQRPLEILTLNQQKLESRQRRNVLRGSGDYR